MTVFEIDYYARLKADYQLHGRLFVAFDLLTKLIHEISN